MCAWNLLSVTLLIAASIVLTTKAQNKADETVVVPAWTIQVVDPSGKPMKHVFVRQVWRDYDMEESDHESDAYTDRNGFVSFPERTEPKVSEDVRKNARLKQVQELGVHASFGFHSYIIAWGKLVGCKRPEGDADYTPGKPLPTKLRTSIATLPGFKCH